MTAEQAERRQDRWAANQRKAGKCSICGKPRNKKRSSWYCTTCLEKVNIQRKLKRKKNRLEILKQELEELEPVKKPAPRKKRVRK